MDCDSCQGFDHWTSRDCPCCECHIKETDKLEKKNVELEKENKEFKEKLAEQKERLAISSGKDAPKDLWEGQDYG